MAVVRDALRSLAAVLGAAMILLAFSEFVFVNEDPVISVIGAEDGATLLAHVGELVLFYVPAGLALAALEPLITSWTRAILAGAFVGWAIEAAVVPVAYEAAPLSYLWTSVGWHAVVDVAFGYLAFRIAMRAGWPMALVAALGLGIAWPLWATWTWPDLQLNLAEFARLAGVVAILTTAGCWLSDRGFPGRGLRHRGWLVAAIVVNGALWMTNAVPYPIEAGGLFVLAALTAWALRRAPVGTAPLLGGRPPAARYLLPPLSCLIAVAVHGWLVETGAPIPPEDVVWPVALLGAAWFTIALGVGLVGRRHA